MNMFKISYLKSTCMVLLLTILSFACSQSNNESKTNAVAAPDIDLNTAVISGNLEAVRQHIEANTDLNEKEPFSGSSPLISAAVFGKTKIAKVLIDAGADLSLKNNDGSTALHVAAFFCQLEIVQLLIDAKADKTRLNNFGLTPRESVLGSFSEIKPIYEMMQQQLAPLGLQFDLDEIEKNRPVVAMMLQD
jgi:ankyrin repeat protein